MMDLIFLALVAAAFFHGSPVIKLALIVAFILNIIYQSRQSKKKAIAMYPEVSRKILLGASDSLIQAEIYFLDHGLDSKSFKYTIRRLQELGAIDSYGGRFRILKELPESLN